MAKPKKVVPLDLSKDKPPSFLGAEEREAIAQAWERKEAMLAKFRADFARRYQ